MAPLFSSTPADDAPTRPPAWRRYLAFWESRVDEDVDDELAFHLEMRVRDYIARGMSEREARTAAAARVGDIPATRAACLTIDRRRQRRMTRTRTVDAFLQDVRYAFRTLGRQKTWTTIAVLTLALGIGATTSVYSVVSSLILHPLPYPDADRVVIVWRVDPTSSLMIGPNKQMIEAWRHAHAFDAFTSYRTTDMSLSGMGDAAVMHAGGIDNSFFSFAGMKPLRGRSFSAE